MRRKHIDFSTSLFFFFLIFNKQFYVRELVKSVLLFYWEELAASLFAAKDWEPLEYKSIEKKEFIR